MGPFPIEAEGMRELLIHGLHDLAHPSHPASEPFGPRRPAITLGQADELKTCNGPSLFTSDNGFFAGSKCVRLGGHFDSRCARHGSTAPCDNDPRGVMTTRPIPSPALPVTRALTAAQCQGLADVPPELAWYAHLTHASTRAASKQDRPDVTGCVGRRWWDARV
jgi:hypothetical protein